MHGAPSSAFGLVLGKCCPEQLRQEFGRVTFGLGTCSIHPQAAVSACRIAGVFLHLTEHAFEDIAKHTAAPDASAAGLTRCLNV